ncbi:hypothetical protein Aduo_016672 [Ancylostoma duodenale]
MVAMKAENLLFSVSIDDGPPVEHEILNRSMIIKDLKRPSKVEVRITPTLGPKDWRQMYEPNVTVLHLVEEAPITYATEVEAVVVSPIEVYIDFEPIPVDKLLGEDAGCKVYVCTEKAISSTCFSEYAPPRTGSVLFSNLEHGGTFYGTVVCCTRAGDGPPSPWIIFDVEKLVIEQKKTTTTKKPRKDRTRPKGASGKYNDVVVITEDTSIRQIDIGISPAYKFDTNCYFYAINATLQDNKRVIESTEEKCYTFTSPSFLILYICVALMIILLTATVSMSRYRRRSSAEAQAKTGAGETQTESSVESRKAKRPRRKPPRRR